jgi:hypothetical protein
MPDREPTAGDEIHARQETLNRRLAALGVYSSSRYDLKPRLTIEDWEKLVALAELGKEWQATAEIYADPAEAARLNRALREADEQAGHDRPREA